MLTALGKTWGRLTCGGSVLEVRRGDLVVLFDLGATVEQGRPVLAGGAPNEYCKAGTHVLD